MKSAYQILRRPVITEKGLGVKETESTLVFEVAAKATKTEVKEAGTEVWKYQYTEHHDGSGAIFLIFGGSSTKEKPHTAFVEIKDGVVTNKWRG